MNPQKIKKLSIKGVLIHALISFLISFLFIWVIGYFFCDSLVFHQYDHTLKQSIHSPNKVYYRSEGFAETDTGLFGINGVENIKNENRKKIVIWGDSYVEAYHVDDKFKIPQVVTNELSANGLGDEIISYGVGMSGNSVADYYFNIPKYEKLTKNTIAHFIIITGLQDILPDQHIDMRGIFKSNPYKLYQDDWNPKFQEIKKILNKFKLYFLWELFKSARTQGKKLQFTPNTIKHYSHTDEFKQNTHSSKFLYDSWSFLLKKLRDQTELPVIFVYCPAIPKIHAGKVIFKNNDTNKIKLFTKIAKENNISVINTTDEFISFYKKTGLFPRGFSNSKPSRGHFNKNGHKIVAEKIMTYMNKRIIK